MAKLIDYGPRNEKLGEFEKQFEAWFRAGDHRAGLCMMRFIVSRLCGEYGQKKMVFDEIMLLLGTGGFVESPPRKKARKKK